MNVKMSVLLYNSHECTFKLKSMTNAFCDNRIKFLEIKGPIYLNNLEP